MIRIVTNLKFNKKSIFSLTIFILIALILCVVVSLMLISAYEVDVKTTEGADVNTEAISNIEDSSDKNKASVEAYVQPDDPYLVLVNSQVQISDDYTVIPAYIGDHVVDVSIYNDLVKMIDDAKLDGLNIYVASAYRDVERQKTILKNAINQRMESGMTKEEAEASAKLTIQTPAYSEHHTGLAVDFNSVSRDFANTKEYAWLQEHAEEYGFVQRYTKDKEDITGIAQEVWHYRYVGVENAKKMNELNMCLEEYNEYIKNSQ